MGLFSFLGDALGTIGSVGSLIPGPWQVPAAAVTAGIGALRGAGRAGKASRLNQQALDLAKRRYQELGPFRSQLASLAQRPLMTEREDLSALFADPGNPYARAIPRSPTTPVAMPPPIQPGRPVIGGGRPRGLPMRQFF